MLVLVQLEVACTDVAPRMAAKAKKRIMVIICLFFCYFQVSCLFLCVFFFFGLFLVPFIYFFRFVCGGFSNGFLGFFDVRTRFFHN